MFLHSLLILFFGVLSTTLVRAREFNAWEEFDGEHPFCEYPIPLGVGQESFFEIANAVEGQEQYNFLIRLYRSRDWDELEQAIQGFKQQYRNSPLLEAATFLEVQSEFDRERNRNEEHEKAAEQKLRKALLKYPKSELAPVVLAGAGAYWLRSHDFQRSLAIYEQAATQYSKDKLYCTFLLGIGEAHFLLRSWKSSELAFKQTMENCGNFRLRAAALIRLADIQWLQERPDFEKAYDQLVEDENPFIERFYPSTLVNVGEVKYRAGKWVESEHYFNRYLQLARNNDKCRPYAAKRLADLGQRRKLSPALVTGRYLSVEEKYPSSDIGHFSKAHGLLMDPNLKDDAELNRRIALVDKESESISDEELRYRLFLEKGITLLDVGRWGALDFLLKLSQQTSRHFDQGKVGDFIREQATREFVDRINQGDLQVAIKKMGLWQRSPLWHPGPKVPGRSALGLALLRQLVQSGDDSDTALKVAEARKVLEPFLSPDYDIVLWLADVLLGIKQIKPPPLSQMNKVAGNLKGEDLLVFRLAVLMGRRRQRDYPRAEAVLSSIGSPKGPFGALTLREGLALAQDRGNSVRAFDMLETALAQSTQDKPTLLKELVAVVEKSRRADLAVRLAKVVNKNLIDPKEKATYLFLAGRQLQESRQCNAASPLLEQSIQLNPQADTLAESYFRLGQCLLQGKNPKSAREQWQHAVDLKDDFWSTLALSELRILSQ